MSPEQPHFSAPAAADAPKTDQWFVDGLKKQTATVLLAAAWAAYTFLYNSQSSLSELRRECEANAKQIETILKDEKADSELHTNILIGLTKSSEAINRIAADVKTLQDQQRRADEQQINRK